MFTTPHPVRCEVVDAFAKFDRGLASVFDGRSLGDQSKIGGEPRGHHLGGGVALDGDSGHVGAVDVQSILTDVFEELLHLISAKRRHLRSHGRRLATLDCRLHVEVALYQIAHLRQPLGAVTQWVENLGRLLVIEGEGDAVDVIDKTVAVGVVIVDALVGIGEALFREDVHVDAGVPDGHGLPARACPPHGV